MMLDLNYVEIILKNGKKSLIDPEDSYYINQWKVQNILTVFNIVICDRGIEVVNHRQTNRVSNF